MRKKQYWRTQDCKLLMTYATPVPNPPGASSCVDDIERILARSYQPSDQDVLKTRLKTVGIQEYRLSIPPDGPCTTFEAAAARFLTPFQTNGTNI